MYFKQLILFKIFIAFFLSIAFAKQTEKAATGAASIIVNDTGKSIDPGMNPATSLGFSSP